jgi:hypothetical protein
MNRYFVFQKVRHVNASKLMPLMEIEPEEVTKKASEPEPEPASEPKPEKVIIRKKKVKGGKIVIG